MANQGYFDNYLKTDDLYVFFNLNDKKSPYQFNYESGEPGWMYDCYYDNNSDGMYGPGDLILD